MKLAEDIGEKAKTLFEQHYKKMSTGAKLSKNGFPVVSCTFNISAELTRHPQSDNPAYENEVVISFNQKTKAELHGKYDPYQGELKFTEGKEEKPKSLTARATATKLIADRKTKKSKK